MKGSYIAFAALVVTVPVYALEDSPHGLSGALAFTTDYLYRGISRTDSKPAGQGRLEYSYKPWGVYLGAWASNVDTDTSDGEVEIDWMGGLRGPIPGTGVGFDLGAIFYYFPGDDLDPEKDYVETKLGIHYQFERLPLKPFASTTVYYSPDFYFDR